MKRTVLDFFWRQSRPSQAPKPALKRPPPAPQLLKALRPRPRPPRPPPPSPVRLHPAPWRRGSSFPRECPRWPTGQSRCPIALRYEDITIGAGPEGEAGKLWHIKYTGWRAADGVKFDSWEEHEQPVIGPDGKPELGPDGKPKMGEPQPIAIPAGRGPRDPRLRLRARGHESRRQAPPLHSLADGVRNARHSRPAGPSGHSRQVGPDLRRGAGRRDRHAAPHQARCPLRIPAFRRRPAPARNRTPRLLHPQLLQPRLLLNPRRPRNRQRPAQPSTPVPATAPAQPQPK